MRSSEILSARIEKSFDRALTKKGYLSLCSIVESQFKHKQNFPMSLRKNTDKITKLKGLNAHSHQSVVVKIHKPLTNKKKDEGKYLEMASLFDLA